MFASPATVESFKRCLNKALVRISDAESRSRFLAHRYREARRELAERNELWAAYAMYVEQYDFDTDPVSPLTPDDWERIHGPSILRDWREAA